MNAPAPAPHGTLFVISAPSGAGKSTLVRALVAADPDLRLSVSHTTRPPRPGEVDGRDYHFVSADTFQQMVQADAFFEYARVHGDMKGTSQAAVQPLLASGHDVLLEIDWQGADQVRRKVPGCCRIFILPPSRAELERRLRARATDSEAAIAKRLADSRQELQHATAFDYIVVNDALDAALADLRHIVAALRLSTPRQRERQAARLRELQVVAPAGGQ